MPMTSKLIILNTGESIIANNIQEAYLEDVLVRYVVENPCQVTITGSYKIIDDEEDSSNRYSISLTLWPRLCNSKTVELFPSSIVTIVEPDESLKKIYENQILKEIKYEANQIVNSDGQTSSDHGN